MVYYKDTPIAGSSVFIANDTVTLCFYNMLIYEYEHLKPIHRVMYEVVKWSTEKGYKYVDIGVSQDTKAANPMTPSMNLIDFKAKFDAKTVELDHFVNVLMREDLSDLQQKHCIQLHNLLIDIERVGDLAEDIAQLALERMKNDVPFTDQAIEELEHIWRCAHDNYRLPLRAFQESSHELGEQVCRQEYEFDQLYWETRQAHIERLEEGRCNPEADVIYTEALRCLDRISDHADNLGVSVSRS